MNADKDKAAANFLADESERLVALPLDTLEDAQACEIECAKMQTEFEKRFPDFGVEEVAEHFFTDSDIRQRDVGYRQWQHNRILEYAKRLRNGDRIKA